MSGGKFGNDKFEDKETTEKFKKAGPFSAGLEGQAVKGCDYKVNGWECYGGWMSPNFKITGVCSYAISPCPKCNKNGQIEEAD